MFRRILFVFLAVLLAASSAFAVEFSADTISTFRGEQQTKGKLFSNADMFRIEMKPVGNMSMIAITRVDKKVAWNIMPETKTYMEIPLDVRQRPQVEDKYEGEIDRKEVGRETIDNHPTIKYLITYKVNYDTNQVYQWVATDIKFPVKTAAVDGSWSQEFRNVKIGHQPDSLFEVPEGYQKVEMPKFPGIPGMKDLPEGMGQIK